MSFTNPTENETIRSEKLAKVEALRQLGHDPYPYTYNVNAKVGELISRYKSKVTAGEHFEDSVSIAGRVMASRSMGKIIFADLKDDSGTIQLHFKEDDLPEQFELVKLIDVGDIIGVVGRPGATRAGELTIFVTEATILTKSLTGLVDQHYGLKDIELRYRNRSLDMTTNQQAFDTLRARYLMQQKIRDFMNSNGFLEVETPIIQTVYGGAEATPFKTYHEKLGMEMYLRVSPEQNLKRLMAGGFEAVYEMGKSFRNENIDRTHNPEFTMLEAYIAYQDYNYMMELVERLYKYVLEQLHGKTTLAYEGVEIDFDKPWQRLTVANALLTLADIDINALSEDQLIAMAKQTGKQLNRETAGEAILVLFEEHCEKKLIQPTHIIDYPKESTVFAKLRRGDNRLIERFESYIGGKEITNGYSELNDPVLQRQYLEDQVALAAEGAEETWGQLDEEFLTAMDLGMPPAAGVGIGIDRMAMVLLDQASIRDIIFFPTMKPLR